MSKRLHILDGESVEEFDALSVSLTAEFKPTTETERYLVEQMIQHEWLMRRALRMQQHLLGTVAEETDADPKRMRLIVRYYRTHEKAASQAKRQLESMRKMRDKAVQRESDESRRTQRQWEQILKKMPPLSHWVN